MKTDFEFDYLSRKCRLLSFVAALAVVAIHSDCTFVLDNPARWNVFVERLFCQRLSKWAVPFFFLMSGRKKHLREGGFWLSAIYRREGKIACSALVALFHCRNACAHAVDYPEQPYWSAPSL